MSEQTERLQFEYDSWMNSEYSTPESLRDKRELLDTSRRIDNLEGWAAGLIQNEHKFIHELDDELTASLNAYIKLEEHINELRMMVECHAKTIKGLKLAEDNRWKNGLNMVKKRVYIPNEDN